MNTIKIPKNNYKSMKINLNNKFIKVPKNNINKNVNRNNNLIKASQNISKDNLNNQNINSNITEPNENYNNNGNFNDNNKDNVNDQDNDKILDKINITNIKKIKAKERNNPNLYYYNNFSELNSYNNTNNNTNNMSKENNNDYSKISEDIEKVNYSSKENSSLKVKLMPKKKVIHNNEAKINKPKISFNNIKKYNTTTSLEYNDKIKSNTNANSKK